MGAMNELQLPEAARTDALIAGLIESTARIERIDTLHALARFLNFKGEHAAAEMLRTELDVFRFMRQHARVDEQPAAVALPSFLRTQAE